MASVLNTDFGSFRKAQTSSTQTFEGRFNRRAPIEIDREAQVLVCDGTTDSLRKCIKNCMTVATEYRGKRRFLMKVLLVHNLMRKARTVKSLKQATINNSIIHYYYMANPVLGKSLCSDWFFLGQDFAVRTVFMETVQSVYFCFGAKPANSTFATKTAKKV